jgi:hypothetical protein
MTTIHLAPTSMKIRRVKIMMSWNLNEAAAILQETIIDAGAEHLDEAISVNSNLKGEKQDIEEMDDKETNDNDEEMAEKSRTMKKN